MMKPPTKRAPVAILLLALAARLSAQIVLTGVGTATIPGGMNSSEWAGAGSFVVTGVKEPGGGTTTATVFAMNDSTNLYMAVKIAGWQESAGGSVGFAFINAASRNTFAVGDNNLLVNSSGLLFDNYYAGPTNPGLSDTAGGGIANGHGAFSTDGTNSYYLFTFPLDTGDALHDFSLSAGESVLFQNTFQLSSSSNGQWTTAFTTSPGFAEFTVTDVPEPPVSGLLVAGVLLVFAAVKIANAGPPRDAPMGDS